MTLHNARLSRREALAALGLMTLSCQTGLGAPAAAKKGGIALQLYTLRDAAKKDLPGTLKKAREIGFQYVQWSGMPNLPAEKIREALDAAGLKAIAGHIALEPFETQFDESLRFWKTVGVRDLAVGGMMKDC
jgi:hypothetical protein